MLQCEVIFFYFSKIDINCRVHIFPVKLTSGVNYEDYQETKYLSIGLCHTIINFPSLLLPLKAIHLFFFSFNVKALCHRAPYHLDNFINNLVLMQVLDTWMSLVTGAHVLPSIYSLPKLFLWYFVIVGTGEPCHAPVPNLYFC